MCGQPPAFLLLLEQTFCLNDTCDVFCWDMTVSAQRNLSEMGQVESFGTMKDGRTWDTRRGDPHPED
jgi:hypothetical protein